MVPASQVAVVYPKLYHNWSSRLGITAPDVTGPMSAASLSITPIGTEGTLVIAVDGTMASSQVELTIVTWNEAGDMIGMTTMGVNLSGWLTTKQGTYIGCQAGPHYSPGFLAIDVSLAAGYTILVQSMTRRNTINLRWKLI